MFYYLTKFYCLVAFNSWDIEQYMCCNSLLTRLWRHKFRKQPYVSNQAVFSTCTKVKTKIWIPWERKQLLRWNKKHFLSFERLSLKPTKFLLEGESPTLGLRILGNQEISGKCLDSIEWEHSAQSPCQNESFVNTSRKLLQSRNQSLPIMRYFT